MSSLHGSDPSAQEEPILILHESVSPNEPVEPKRTPLPKFQLFIVFLIQFSEPVTSTVIYPFVNQFVRDTGVIEGDERKTGYYAGMIVRCLSRSVTCFSIIVSPRVLLSSLRRL